MSSPKSFTTVEDPEVLRRRAEELMRREQERYDTLSGTPRDQLNDEDFALCSRVEERTRAVEAIAAQQCTLLRAEVIELNAKLEQAAKTRRAVIEQADGLVVPPVPAALDDRMLASQNPEEIRSALSQIKIAVADYEAGFAKARQDHAARANTGSMRSDAAAVSGVLCYSGELEMKAYQLEQKAIGQIKSQLRAMRSDAEELVSDASKSRGIPLSSDTLQTFRAVLESDQVGIRSEMLNKLRSQIREDARNHRTAEVERERLEAEMGLIRKQAVLIDVCRQMGWDVVPSRDPKSGSIYVAERGFTNHLRELRLTRTDNGETRLVLQTVEIEGARNRVGDPQRLRDEHREFETTFCGKGGSLLKVMEKMRDNAISLQDMREEFPPDPEPFPLIDLPRDLQARMNNSTTAEKGTARLAAAPLPKGKR